MKMKKPLYLFAITVALIVAFNINLHIIGEATPLRAIAIEQVEALANIENGGSTKCAMLGCLDCPENAKKVKYIN
ncbi:hypothetical protein ORI89_01415 [Sphingobacterium sp. UT-1RO-CII-1]|uniref:hypothetical protein n=1 Tax=Sphingobacterium sp. UT-1RO-CII-1 TaxID=2995225 RepID=UPI00227BFC11|nr:hypothetical protein [Sphingobacterium sp. UT-1RO-CII-1]MCY4778293.1 hypothetical protein [Sphingobacterium sp. UT-1RO-CII-1]